MVFQNIIYERRDSIAFVTLNRPDKLNALNADLMAEFREALEVVEADPEVRVAIVTRGGTRLFGGL